MSQIGQNKTQEDKAKALISKHTTLVGQLFALSPESVNKLNFDLEDRVHDHLASINHKGCFLDSDEDKRMLGRMRKGLEISQVILNLRKAQSTVCLTFLCYFSDPLFI